MVKSKTKKEGIEIILTNKKAEIILCGLDLLKEKHPKYIAEIEEIQTELIMKKVQKEQLGILDVFK